MKKLQYLLSIGFILCIFISNSFAASKEQFSWLKNIEGKQALSWVKQQNKHSLNRLESDTRFETLRKDAETIYLAEDRIPYGAIRGDYVYNFWTDKKNIRGIWRRTKLKKYLKNPDKVEWQTLLNVDELGKKEKESWVWKGANCLPPTFERCLISLSRGGKDAEVVREFEVSDDYIGFVKNGFSLREGPNNVTWVDRNTLLVAASFGPGSLTTSQYPRIIKMWKRGQSLSDARTMLEGEKNYVSVGSWAIRRSDKSIINVSASLSFFERKRWILNDHHQLVELPLPLDVSVEGYFKGGLFLKLRSDWGLKTPKNGVQVFTAGSIVQVDLDVFVKNGEMHATAFYVPDNKTVVQGLSVSRDYVWVSVLQDIKGKILRFKKLRNNSWRKSTVKIPQQGRTGIIDANPFSNDLFVYYEDFLTPTSLYYLANGKTRPKIIKKATKRFSAKGLVVEQKWVASKDGTQVPYFLIRHKRTKLNGKNPTLLYGYGGFEISRLPSYLGTIGKLWLERGGIYVVANIRGGGEFGPKWHQAALKENRQRSYDDFIAIAEDLIKHKITSPKYLGIMGGQ